ncbi:MAG: hypothetical protein Q8P28_04385 [Deltaproteobacteria bacterium]|nr:hypothetical protein [Deltaproteobacteria bacterium]
MNTGISESKTDCLQPYRVWYKGFIVRFCKTKEEAERYLKEKLVMPEKLRPKNKEG